MPIVRDLLPTAWGLLGLVVAVAGMGLHWGRGLVVGILFVAGLVPALSAILRSRSGEAVPEDG